MATGRFRVFALSLFPLKKPDPDCCDIDYYHNATTGTTGRYYLLNPRTTGGAGRQLRVLRKFLLRISKHAPLCWRQGEGGRGGAGAGYAIILLIVIGGNGIAILCPGTSLCPYAHSGIPPQGWQTLALNSCDSSAKAQ